MSLQYISTSDHHFLPPPLFSCRRRHGVCRWRRKDMAINGNSHRSSMRHTATSGTQHCRPTPRRPHSCSYTSACAPCCQSAYLCIFSHFLATTAILFILLNNPNIGICCRHYLHFSQRAYSTAFCALCGLTHVFLSHQYHF